MDITKISIEDLKKDKQESLEDIIVCEDALKINVRHYSGGSVQDRLDVNKRIVVKIDKELLRRESKGAPNG